MSGYFVAPGDDLCTVPPPPARLCASRGCGRRLAALNREKICFRCQAKATEALVAESASDRDPRNNKTARLKHGRSHERSGV